MSAHQNYCVMNLCDAYHIPLVGEVLQFLEENQLRGFVPEHLAVALYVCCWRAEIPRSLEEVCAMTQCFPFMVMRIMKQINNVERIVVKPSDVIQRYLPEINYKRRQILMRDADQLQVVAPTFTPEKCLAVVMLEEKETSQLMREHCTSLTDNVVRRAAKQVMKINGLWHKKYFMSVFFCWEKDFP